MLVIFTATLTLFSSLLLFLVIEHFLGGGGGGDWCLGGVGVGLEAPNPFGRLYQLSKKPVVQGDILSK